ncbi:MAG: hypothetical protein UT55_C0040G0001 [Candidatus Peregrinibacteria bacterium GW2011_GWE2_39_6]|nr:MAG: hypothetical protein UT55_C0040G0001 [Candidatus Peregrinibacteria bacterium GW2011_GWE2_39_6]
MNKKLFYFLNFLLLAGILAIPFYCPTNLAILENWDPVLNKRPVPVVTPTSDRIRISTTTAFFKNQFYLDALDSSTYEMKIALKQLIGNPESYLPFSALVEINGHPIGSVFSGKLSVKNWKSTSLKIPITYLKVGYNVATLHIDKNLINHYLTISIAPDFQSTINQVFCLSDDQNGDLQCLPKNFSYSFIVTKTPDLASVLSSEYLYILDKEKYALLNCKLNHAAFGPENQYFIDLLENQQLEKLKNLSFKGDNDYEIATNIMLYLYENYSAITSENKTSSPVNGNSVYSMLFGFDEPVLYCSHVAYSFVTLAYLQGIDARPVFLENLGGGSGHVVAEAFINNKWVMFDPFTGITFQEKGKYFSVRDIYENSKDFEQYLVANKPQFSKQITADPITPYYEHFKESTILCGSERLSYYDSHLPLLPY